MQEIAIHKSAEDDTVIKFVKLCEFPATVQALANRGEIWGAYLLPNGRVVVEEIGHILHETNISL
jgi:hypothetical protein